jgi:adenine-specific DNA-methyltransferase
MWRTKGKPVPMTAPSLFAERIEEFRMLFPEAFTEGKIDFDKMKMALGEEVDGRPERYSFAWAGKKDAIRLLQIPSRATLIPDKDESVDFDNTQNMFIEGDNLEVLKLLWKPYFGRVKMIYIDPPYNTGEDFIYPDNYADPLSVYLMLTGQRDIDGNLLISNPETSGRFHSAWLSMLYPRLFLARQLLREDGVVFVSVDDTELANLHLMMNEIFGEDNFISCVIWQNSVQPKGYLSKFSVHHNYILCYQRSDYFSLESLPRTEEHNRNYSNPDNDPKGLWRPGDVRNALYRPNLIFDIETPSGKVIKPPRNGWRWSKQTTQKKIETGEIIFSEDETRIIRKIYLVDVQGRAPETIWFENEVGGTREANQELKDLFGGLSPFDTAKPTRLIKRMLQISTEPRSNDIILDFFAGSSSTAHAIMEINREDGGNRSFIMVQLPEPVIESTPSGMNAKTLGLDTISDVGKERIRSVIAKMNKEAEGKLDLGNRETPEDLGFKVFKLAESNYRSWAGVEDKDPEAYAKQMELYLDPLVEGWQEENVIYEVAVKEGYSLACLIEKVDKISENTVWRVTDKDKEQSFYICLDDDIKEDAVKALELNTDYLFICRDKALTDELAANLALQCNLKVI